MKRLLLTLIALAAVLSFNGCSRDEKTALEEFKKDFASFKAFTAEKKKATNGTDEAAAKAAMKEMVAKAKAIKTDGLPADLKDPWVSSVNNVEKITAIFTDTPTDPTKVDPAKMAEMQKQMEGLTKQMDEDQKKLTEAGKKYGIEGLDKIGE